MPADTLGRISGIMLKNNLLRQGVDLAFENDLIYLDVESNRVGIRSSSPTHDLTVTGTTSSSELLVDTSYFSGNLRIIDNNITTVFGSLTISAAGQIVAPEIRTADIGINNNYITTSSNPLLDIIDGGSSTSFLTSTLDLGLASTTTFGDVFDLGNAELSGPTTNTSLEIRPNGTGKVLVFGNLNTTGSIHSTGDITLDGTIIFGNNDSDSVTFNADIASDIVPDQHYTYNLGRADRRWSETHSVLINGQLLTTEQLQTDAGIDLALRQGKIWYVATNGSDTNDGEHQSGAFATIKHALSQATSGDTVFIYPGTYTEQFPLIVNEGISVNGFGIRSVKVIPTPATNTNNAFVLNGQTTVSDLTVADFYSPGYAFSFDSGFSVTSRSPYVKNITVITKGSVTSETDPRGFDSGDAGRGALVDGSQALSTSNEASMLFHAVTFITPGVDAITMTNGVRVEWLNSFTYYASRGLYATDGSLGFAGLAVKFGAEIRSIGSANIYGTYGAVADGASTLMYLIQHNFAYIGTGKDTSNDKTLVIQANETQELNSGKIYYQSQDHEGTWRVGDAFFANLEDGTVSFDTSGIDLDNISSLTVSTGNEITYIDFSLIRTGNLRLQGNTFESLLGNLDVNAASGTINLTQNVNVDKNVSITGDFSIDGGLTLGNQSTDTIKFFSDISQDFVPDVNDSYALGSSTRVWQELHTVEANIDSVRFYDNVITINSLNTNLILTSDGTGTVVIPTSNVQVNQNVDVVGQSNIRTTNITGLVNHTGTRNITGSIDSSGFLAVTNNLTVDQIVYLPQIRIQTNNITVTNLNTDLVIKANGTGSILISNSDLDIDNNLTALSTATTNGITVANRTTSDEFYSNDILINDNSITTTKLNSNLIFVADNLGSVFVETQEIVSNTIKNTDNIILRPGTVKNTDLDSTGSLKIPVGNNVNRPLANKAQGDLRFNTADNTFEGFDGITSRGLGGVFSADRETSVKASKTTNVLNFVAGTVAAMEITTAGMRINGLYVDNLEFDNSLILANNTDLFLTPTGTGLNRFESITFDSNEIQNDLSTAITLSATGNGYVRLTGTDGFIMPYGNDADRTPTPEIGETRYNIEREYIEIWDGISWINSGGVGGNVTGQQMEDLSYLWNLILG